MPSFFIVQAQDIDYEDSVMDMRRENLIIYSQLNNFNSVKVEQVSFNKDKNTVYIQQEGIDNQAFFDISIKYPDILLHQRGDNNRVDISESSRYIEKNINQFGSNNTVLDYSFNPNMSTSLELSQTGNNLSFERFGSNKLFENIKLNMKGNSKTIIIRNF